MDVKFGYFKMYSSLIPSVAKFGDKLPKYAKIGFQFFQNQFIIAKVAIKCEFVFY